MDYNKVRDLARFFWEQEGRPVGRDKEHWYRAEREVDQWERPRSMFLDLMFYSGPRG